MACTNKDRQIALQLYVRSRAVLGLFHVKNEQFNKKANYYEANATGFSSTFKYFIQNPSIFQNIENTTLKFKHPYGPC